MKPAHEAGRPAQDYTIVKNLLCDQVITAIADYIVDNGIGYGDPLPSELTMAELFGVGRNTVREAVRALKMVGIVEAQQNKGLIFRGFSVNRMDAFVPFMIMDQDHYQSNLQARLWYEKSIIPMVLRRITAEDIAYMHGIIEESRTYGRSVDAFLDSDVRFHSRMAQCVGNSTIRDIGKIIHDFFTKIPPPLESELARQFSRIIQEHEHILDCLRNKDGEALTSALDTHLNREVNFDQRQRRPVLTGRKNGEVVEGIG